MPLSYDSSLFNTNPYYDDFDEDKKFLRTLFRPGTAVQARELTQLQTILQVQIERMGSHIFDNGAVIIGGGIGESKINFARLGTADAPSSTVLSNLVGQQIYDTGLDIAGDGYSTSGTNAKILHVLGGSTLSSDSNQVIFYQYTSNGTFTEAGVLGTTGSDSIGATFSIQASGNTAPSIGTDANIFTVDEGIFYVDGYFVKNSKQSIVPFSSSVNDEYRSFSSPTSSIGWKIKKDIVSHNDDVTLRDPAAGFYNYNAPGADRFKLNLSLDHIPFVSSLGSASGLTFDSEDFIELVRMVGGSSTKTVKYTDYAEIEETFARRTQDESGNYTVNAPKLRVTTHGDVFTPADDSNKFAVGVEPNKCYVGGFEVDTQSTAYLEVDKTKDLGVVPSYGEVLSSVIGNYVHVEQFSDGGENDPVGGFGGISSGDLNESALALSKQSSFSIWRDVYSAGDESVAGASIGSCNFRAMKLDGSDLKVYLFNIGMSSGYKFSQAEYLVSDHAVQGHTGPTGVHFRLKANSAGWTGPHDAGKRSMIFPTMGNKTVATGPGYDKHYNSKFVVQKTSLLHFAEDIDGNTIYMNDGKGLLDSDDENYLVWFGSTADTESGEEGRILPTSGFNATVYGENTSNAKLVVQLIGASGPAGGCTASIIHPVIYDSNMVTGQKIYRALTQTNNSDTQFSTPVTESVTYNGVVSAKFTLNHSHVYSISSASHNGESLSLSSVTLEDGQRQSAYYKSTVYIPTSLLTDNEGYYNVNFVYDYYTHTGIGPVIANSYPDSYEDIPTFNDPDSGKRMPLRNYIDFRPVQNTDGTFTEFGIPFTKYGSSHSKIGYSYFMPRIDKVTLCSDRVYRVVKGVPSLTPQAPPSSSEDLDLYLLKMNPYIFNLGNDVNAHYIDNRRYTMKEIGELENQVENVERDRYLEILYSDATAKGAGESDTTLVEEGTLIDDFSGHAFDDVSNRDNNCSMDFKYRGLKVPFTTNVFKFDVNTLPTGLTMSDDRNITYDFTEQKALGVSFGTVAIPVNPYGNTDFLGYVKLDPSSDFWYDAEKNPSVLVNSFGENNQYQVEGNAWQEGRSAGWGSEYGEWRSHWLGSEDLNEDINEVDPLDRNYKLPVKTAWARLPDRVVRTSNSRTVDESVIPYMRSTGITFSATGLLPGSTVYAMFDGVLVGASGTGYSADSQGGVSGHITVDNSYLTGEKSFRITNSRTDTLSATTTAADVKFFSQGMLNYKNSTIISDRPAQSRRKSVNSDSIISGPYLNTVDGNYSSVQNGLDPLTQEIIVDSGVFPQGVFLRSIDLFFKDRDPYLPVTIHIRPMFNGAPHDFLVVPHSEVTMRPSSTSSGPNSTQNTNFKFGSPVFLSPGSWAICIMSNSTQNEVFKAHIGDIWLDIDGTVNSGGVSYTGVGYGNGIGLGSMFLPLNNGTRQKSSLDHIMMNINRCSFNGGSDDTNTRTVLFDANVPAGVTAYGSIANVICNDQLFTSDDVNLKFKLLVDNEPAHVGIIPNKDIVLNQEQLVNETGDMQLSVEYSSTTSNALTPVIDTDRLSAIFIKNSLSTATNPTDTGSALGETQTNSAGANTKARYVSKKIHFGNLVANDLRVYLDIALNEGHVKVFAKVNNNDENFDLVNWIQLYKDGDSSAGGEWMTELEPEQLTHVTFSPATGTSLGDFSVYAIKIVVFKGDTNHSAYDMPVIKNLKAVALQT